MWRTLWAENSQQKGNSAEAATALLMKCGMDVDVEEAVVPRSPHSPAYSAAASTEEGFDVEVEAVVRRSPQSPAYSAAESEDVFVYLPRSPPWSPPWEITFSPGPTPFRSSVPTLPSSHNLSLKSVRVHSQVTPLLLFFKDVAYKKKVSSWILSYKDDRGN